MISVLHFIRWATQDNRGANALEYALVMGLVGLAIVGGAGLLGGNINTLFNSAGTALGSVTVPSL